MGNFTTSGSATYKAGDGMTTNIPKEAWDLWISGAEAYINVATRFNWSDEYSTLNDDVKYVLEDTASSKVAMNAIGYDMSGYSSRSEAETMVDILTDSINNNITILKEIKSRDFVTEA